MTTHAPSSAAQHVVVLGGGLMGSQIALEYAAFGHSVRVITRSPERTRQNFVGAVRAANLAGLGAPDEMAAIVDAIPVATRVERRDPSADLIVESLPEDLELKVDVLAATMEMCPDATVASNTSSFSIRALADLLPDPSRVLGTHYWNPPLLMPLVELVITPRSDPYRVESVGRVLRGMHKRPVEVGDSIGFVWNRLQFCLLREASSIVSRGLATAEEVDAIVESGLARRWVVNGPFATAQLGGVDTFVRVAAQILPDLDTTIDLESLPAQTYLDEAMLSARAAERDRYLGEARAKDATDGRHATTNPKGLAR